MKKYFLPTSLLVLFSLLITEPVFSKKLPYKIYSSIITDDPIEKKPNKKERTERNKTAIKIYPDAWKRIMHVVVKGKTQKTSQKIALAENDQTGETENEIDFFVFDMQGTLILNYKMKTGSHERIAGLARGTYIYRVFTGDEETASGDFEIK